MAFGKAVESAGFVKVKSNGIHTVTLVRVGSQTRNNGSKALSMTVNGGGEYDDLFYDFLNTNYAASYVKADGGEGQVLKQIVNPLATIVGVEDDTVEPQSVETKNGAKMVDTFVALSGTGTKIKIAVQMQYNDYYKEMKPVITAVFNEDGFSATELDTNASEPKRIKLYENIEDRGGDNKPASAPAGKTAEEEANDAF